MKGRLVLALIIFIFSIQIVVATQFLPVGFVLNDCTIGATVNVTTYNQGFINVPGQQADTVSGTTSGTGAFGLITGILTASTLYDINITVTNPSCATASSASVALFNQTSGGPIDPPVQIDVNITFNSSFAAATPGNNSIIGTNQTPFTWVSDYAGVTYNLQISTSSTFATLTQNLSGIATTTYTLNSSQELADGIYYWRVRAVNGSSSVIDTSEAHEFQVAAGEAVLTNFIPGNDTYVSGTSFTLGFTSDKNADCRYANTTGVAYASKTAFSTNTTTHSGTVSMPVEGVNRIYIQCNATDSGMVNGNDYGYGIRRDTIAPSAVSAVVVIENGSAYSTDTTLDFNWSGFNDSGSGVVAYYYSLSDGGGGTSGTATNGSTGTISSAPQGGNTVYVWARDAVGNIGTAVSDTITVDSLPPAFSSWISSPTNLTRYSTGSFTVDFTITESSAFNATPTYRYRIGNDNWSNWTNATFVSSFSTTYNYRFSIAEQSSPNTWFERSNENLTYQVYAADVNNNTNNVTRADLIDNRTSAPVLSTIANQLANESTELAFNMSATDADNDVLTYACNMSGATVTKVNNTLATVAWTPGQVDVGSKTYNCNVTDGTFVVSQNFTITVLNINDDPILTLIGDLYAQEYVYFNLTINATDEDNDTLSYDANGTLFSLSRFTGEIAFTPTASDRGAHKINFTVSDGKGGVDYESITFTVGYCGDSVCKASFESCSTCELDCGVCGTEQTKAIVLETRNCLNEAMTVHAVTLVDRATCSEEGDIINNREVCGDEANAELAVYIQVDTAWELLYEVTADEAGLATFTPDEKGDYEVAYSSDRTIYTPFGIDECLEEEKTDDGQQTSGGSDPTQPPTLPPTIEEPVDTTTVEEGLSVFASLLYFLIIPLLFVALVISAMGYVYKLEKNKPKSTYVDFVDKWMKVLLSYWTKAVTWMKKTTPFKEIFKYAGIAKTYVVKYWKLVEKDIINYWNKLIVVVGLQRKLSVPIYHFQAPGKELHLLLISLIKYRKRKENINELLNTVHSYTIRSIFDIAALLMTFGIRVRIIEQQPSDPTYLKAMLMKGLSYRQGKATRVDIESAVHAGNPVVCPVTQHGEKGVVKQTIIVIYSFDKEHFYYHDYQLNKFNLKVQKDALVKAWRESGTTILFVQK